ncbi:MAG: hypothetical protein AB7O04_12815 [Hyphomonadaceae bacterium]
MGELSAAGPVLDLTGDDDFSAGLRRFILGAWWAQLWAEQMAAAKRADGSHGGPLVAMRRAEAAQRPAAPDRAYGCPGPALGGEVKT